VGRSLADLSERMMAWQEFRIYLSMFLGSQPQKKSLENCRLSDCYLRCARYAHFRSLSWLEWEQDFLAFNA